MLRFGAVLLLALAAFTQASVPAARVSSLTGQNDKPYCDKCVKLVQAVKTIVDNPQLDNELIKVLQGICDRPLFAPIEDKCLNLVNYIIVGLHEVQSLLDNPTAVCEAIHFCDDTAPASGSTIVKGFFLAYASKIVHDTQPGLASPEETCQQCTDTVNKVEKLLKNPTIDKILTKLLEQICKAFSEPEQDQCKQGIEKWFPKAFTFLVDLFCNANRTCRIAHLCPSQASPFEASFPQVSHPHLDRLLAKLSAQTRARGIDFGCAACKTAVAGIEDVLKTNKSITLMSNGITTLVCNDILPSSLKAGCDDFLGIYLNAAIELTVTEWSPTEICADIHACQSSTVRQLGAHNGHLVCDACKALTKTLAYELQQPKLQQEIVNVLKSGCHLLPGELGDKCTDLVLQYVPAGLAYAADFCSRDDACTVLHLC